MTRTIGIISIKGGVGKTSCVAQLGSTLADMGKRVLLVDANFSAPNLGFHFGIINPKNTLHTAIKKRNAIEKSIYAYNNNLHLIPGSLISENINPFLLKHHLNNLKQYYDIILIDSSPNLNHEILAAMVAADELLVVTNPDIPTLSCTMNAIKEARRKHVPITGIILNKARGKDFELSIEEIEEGCGVPVIGYLQETSTVPESVAYNTPLPYYQPRHDVAIEMKKLASALLHQPYNDTRILPKIKRFFDKSLRKTDVNQELLRQGKA